MVSKDLLRRVLLGKDDYGDAWREMRDKFLSVYEEALSSRCTPLVKMIQVVMIILAKSTLDAECCFLWNSHKLTFAAHNTRDYLIALMLFAFNSCLVKCFLFKCLLGCTQRCCAYGSMKQEPTM